MGSGTQVVSLFFSRFESDALASRRHGKSTFTDLPFSLRTRFDSLRESMESTDIENPHGSETGVPSGTPTPCLTRCWRAGHRVTDESNEASRTEDEQGYELPYYFESTGLQPKLHVTNQK